MANDGGPAFPSSAFPSSYNISAGMSLRDYFAGQVLANSKVSDFNGEGLAKTAYRIADFMLRVRNA